LTIPAIPTVRFAFGREFLAIGFGARASRRAFARQCAQPRLLWGVVRWQAWQGFNS
jgi:hypothetical protein